MTYMMKIRFLSNSLYSLKNCHKPFDLHPLQCPNKHTCGWGFFKLVSLGFKNYMCGGHVCHKLWHLQGGHTVVTRRSRCFQFLWHVFKHQVGGHATFHLLHSFLWIVLYESKLISDRSTKHDEGWNLMMSGIERKTNAIQFKVLMTGEY